MVFDEPPTLQSKSLDKFSCQLDTLALGTHDIPESTTTSDIYKENNTDPDKAPPTEIISNPEKGCTRADIVVSKHKLFFIKYTPDHTLRQRWYSVQVDLEATLEMNKDRIDIYSYYCVFLAKHPNDAKKSDEFSRFWQKWYKYTRDSKTNQFFCGDRYLIRPNQFPDKDKFIQWTDMISICPDKSQYIIGPFEFEKN